MKKNAFLFFCVVMIMATTSNAQISDVLIDDAGDIIITAYHNNPDAFSFVFLDDCPNTTSIRFIDEEWTGSSFHANDGEGEVLWINNSGTTIPRGTVVHITNADNNGSGIQASHGTVSEIGIFNTSSGDEVIAITGTRDIPGSFLTFYGDANGPTLNGTGLVNGTTALQDNLLGMGYYSGPDHCSGLSLDDCAKQLTNLNNWTLTNEFSIPENVVNTMHLSETLGRTSEGIKGFKFGPNPVINTLWIQAHTIIKRIEIYHLNGEKIQEQQILQNQLNIRLTHLISGVYFAKVHADDRISTFLFIKN